MSFAPQLKQYNSGIITNTDLAALQVEAGNVALLLGTQINFSQDNTKTGRRYVLLSVQDPNNAYLNVAILAYFENYLSTAGTGKSPFIVNGNLNNLFQINSAPQNPNGEFGGSNSLYAGWASPIPVLPGMIVQVNADLYGSDNYTIAFDYLLMPLETFWNKMRFL